jgi:signal transduction histidine kinase
MRGARIAAWSLAVAAPLLVVLDALRWLPSPDAGAPGWIWPFALLAVLAPAVVGLGIALRQPRNTIAWIMLVGAFLAGTWPELVGSRGWSLQIARAVWPLLYAWPIAVAFVFPDGRLLSRRWRYVAGIGAFCFVGFMAVAMFDRSPFDAPDQSVPNPMAGVVFPHWLEWIWVPLWLGVLGSLFAGAIAIRLRLRRSGGIERLQTLWLAWAASLIPLGLVLCAIGHLAFGGPGAVLFAFLLTMEAAVAVAIGIAVVRYRLYAIERLVNRTLVYASLTVLLAGAYAVVALAGGVVVGHGSGWVTAAATLVVAVAFRPLRAGVQRAVNRRFDRGRFDALRLVAELEAGVREGRRAPEEIGSVLAEALGDPLSELLYWLPASEAYANGAGELVPGPVADGRAVTEISANGSRAAVLAHDPALADRPDFVSVVLRAATLSIEIARLRVELRLQLQEVQASRARIVEAGYEERRRLERDLHDGAQQRLVSLGLGVRRLQRTLPREAQVLSPAFDAIVDEIGSAIADLRQIAAGVRPARLDEGLAAALADLARSSPVQVDVHAPIGRVPASVEAAAYFVVCEALTNAVKHASASRVAIGAHRDNGSLRVTVSDDGCGGATVRRGSGLAGLIDRVAAHGGSLDILSPSGGGTQIEVAIPCES